MKVVDEGVGVVVELTDEDVVALRTALRRLFEWQTNPEKGEHLLPTPEEAAAAYDLKDQLYEVPVYKEAIAVFGIHGKPNVTFEVKRKGVKT